MTISKAIQNTLRAEINVAILSTGKDNNVQLPNTEVVEALLEVAGLYASVHGFEDYTPIDLAFKHANTIQGHIE